MPLANAPCRDLDDASPVRAMIFVCDCGFRVRSSSLIFLVDSNPSITGMERSGEMSMKKPSVPVPTELTSYPSEYS